MEKVSELQGLLLGASHENLNEITKLFALCESEDLRVVVAALSAIGKVLAHHRRLAVDSETEGLHELAQWLRGHNKALRQLILQLAASGEVKAQLGAIRLTLMLLKDEAAEINASTKMSGQELARLFGLLPIDSRFPELLTELLLAPRWNSQVAECILSEYVVNYADIRHYLLSHLRNCAEQAGKALPKEPVVRTCEETPEGETQAAKRKRLNGPFAEAAFQKGRTHEEIFERILALLTEVREPQSSASKESEDDEIDNVWLETSRSSKQYRKEYARLFQEAWLKLLGLRVPLAHCTSLLQLLPTKVIPHMGRPLMVADFYLRAFHAGSLELSVLALSGLLLLLTRYGLGDPETLSSSCGEFYSQLYSLLRPATFRLNRRARFQRLAAAALTSALLPARFAAAFAKKCLRVAILCSEPGTIMWLLAVAYGLIQRNHSRCSVLLHRAGEEGAAMQKDPFELDANLQEASEQVVQSSLWEIQLLFRHHLPAVSTLAKLFEKPFFKPTARKLDPELFLDQGMVKAYQQALKAAERQVSKLKARGAKCPLAFQVQDIEPALRCAGWAAALSTGQRRVGAGL